MRGNIEIVLSRSVSPV